MADLADRLEESKDTMRKLIITDGVFSMEGDLANLPEIVELARKNDALVAVDDSHAHGVLGKSGRGTPEHFGVTVDAPAVAVFREGELIGQFEKIRSKTDLKKNA